MAREPSAARLTSIWIGALLFWIMKGFTTKFSEQLSAKYEKRNFISGYLVSITFLLFVVYLFVK
jgi:hypothetical protein